MTHTKESPVFPGRFREKSDLIKDVPSNEQKPLTSPQQLAIKRSRLNVEILKRPSDNATKYDLFQRLNAGGIVANAQELRNCIVIMVNRHYADFLRAQAEWPEFLTVLAASEDQIEKQRHMEYASRFLVHTYVPYDGKLDVEEFIDEGIVTLATANETQQAGTTFSETFNLLNQAYGGDALRRFQNGVPGGRVGLAAFEGIAVGIAKNLVKIKGKPNPVEYVKQRILEFWRAPGIQNFFVAGLRGTVRIQRTVPFGTAWFSV